MVISIYQVDAFTDRPFRGNPAAVCLLPGPARDAWMQAIAAEMNLSETAFLHPDGKEWRLRWFTPLVEVDLCGHATLASAFILWQSGALAVGLPAIFHTRSGVLTARQANDWIEMDFPAVPATPQAPPPELIAALGVQPVAAGRATDWLVEMGSADEVRSLRPNLEALSTLGGRGTIVTAPGNDGVDFVSRFFAPAVGIAEDPVTGSAHCTLGPWWANRLGRRDLTGYQASARGGTVRVRLVGDRVVLGGQAVEVFSGRLDGPAADYT
ncbi:MAG: PhzF family phenazine biosynthesis protein [Dehalococcoidia bacterium]